MGSANTAELFWAIDYSNQIVPDFQLVGATNIPLTFAFGTNKI